MRKQFGCKIFFFSPSIKKPLTQNYSALQGGVKMHIPLFPSQNSELFNSEVLWFCFPFPFILSTFWDCIFSKAFQQWSSRGYSRLLFGHLSPEGAGRLLQSWELLNLSPPGELHLFIWRSPFQRGRMHFRAHSYLEERALHKACISHLNVPQGSAIAPEAFSVQIFRPVPPLCVWNCH